MHQNNIIKYTGKTNPNVWLEDYRLMCRAGVMEDDLFSIQLLPIYLADSARAWLYHMPMYVIDSWRISRRYSPATSKALMYDLTTLGT
jgi:hypothetical protein